MNMGRREEGKGYRVEGKGKEKETMERRGKEGKREEMGGWGIRRAQE